MSEQNADERLIEALAETRWKSMTQTSQWRDASSAARTSYFAFAKEQLGLLRAMGARITLPEPPKRYPVEMSDNEIAMCWNALQQYLPHVPSQRDELMKRLDERRLEIMRGSVPPSQDTVTVTMTADEWTTWYAAFSEVAARHLNRRDALFGLYQRFADSGAPIVAASTLARE